MKVEEDKEWAKNLGSDEAKPNFDTLIEFSLTFLSQLMDPNYRN